MDFTKYVDMLVGQSLFFARLDRLGDKFEGTYPKENHDRFEERARLLYDELRDLPEEERRMRYEREKNVPSWTSKFNQRTSYVNCWHANGGESAAMWRLYLKSDEGIAVRSTTKRLAETFDKTLPDVFIANVKYIDYSRDAIENPRNAFNTIGPIIHKRQSFEHEREIRAFILQGELLAIRGEETTINLDRETPPEMNIGIDLNKLIESVLVSPTAPDWFYRLVSRPN